MVSQSRRSGRRCRAVQSWHHVRKRRGRAEERREAAQWYRLAADQGLAGAQFNLGIMYTEGKGVPQDHVLAHMWLDLVVSELPPSGKEQRNTTVDALHRCRIQNEPGAAR